MIHTASRVLTIAAALALVPLGLVIGGCSSTLDDTYAQDQLEQARAAYAAAKADPHVEATAPDMLLEANLALQEAEKAHNADKMSSFAYVAQKKVQTARSMTEGKMAEAQLQKMSKENTALLMQKREREARLANERAAMTAQEARQAKEQMATREQELAKVRQEAQQNAATAEEARKTSEQARAEAMQARTEQAELMRELSNMKATETERGLVVTLGDVLFETGKSDISPRAKNAIDKLADFLNNHPDRNLMIEGYTDNVGSAAYNKDLSERRADAVRQALADRGVDDDRISIKGNGKTNPVASNDTRHGRQLNRRVEVIILNQGAAGGRVSQ
ncbi:OmpA family protein [Geomonas sp. RF6]|uniref:OmpA family protein n=1 Tax=Geomonas sp. RF6 TaxID=2897342 RepID=UPI001E4DFF5A|nr:OmpA family protein [Geomonas sp. RF6]UFS70494.1 OmpA family protein [Geomonas sp. RF6]